MSTSAKTSDRYAVILAGGDGTRLSTFTRAIAGDDRPKQFCPLFGRETLLDRTRRRVEKVVPASSIMFSLTQKHSRFFREPLAGVENAMMVVQPENRGTAPAILYCLARLAKLGENATVAFFPSDHFFGDESAFVEQAEKAFAAAERNPESVILLGIEPENAETSYGWVEPAESLFGSLRGSVSRVSRFWEKPTAGVATELMKAGCLWNSFVMIGKVSTFVEMFKSELPDMYRMFAAAASEFGTRGEEAVMRSIYSWIHDTNFSSEVLAKATGRLMVMRVAEVGWSDLGEPERVINALGDTIPTLGWTQAVAA